jgi:site-specific DNA recombinase
MCFCLCRSFRAVGEKSYFGALTKEKFSDIVVLVTDRRTESEQPKMKKKCYLYTRVSTAAQIEGYSLEAQTEKLRGYAAYRELEIAGEYCDAGKSGKSIKGRPAFQQMLDDIVSEEDGISFVLVFKLSRFGRNAADVLKSMQLLTDYGVDLVCVEDAIDSSTQGGRLTMAILSAVAEIEKENITVQFLS